MRGAVMQRPNQASCPLVRRKRRAPDNALARKKDKSFGINCGQRVKYSFRNTAVRFSHDGSKPMLIALDTATEWCSVGLASTDLTDMLIVSRRIGTGHSAYLLPMLDDLLRQRQTPVSAISTIVVTVGPGSFTGLRIACGVAHGLALSQNLPVIPLSTLEVIAQRFKGQSHPTVVCLDARMDELYCAVFDAKGVRLVADFVGKPDEVSARVVTLLDTKPFNAAGNGWALATTKKCLMFSLVNQLDEQAYPQASDMLYLGAKQLSLDPATDTGLTVDLVSNPVARPMMSSDKNGARNQRWLAQNALPIYIRNDIALDIAAQRQLRWVNEQSRLQDTQAAGQ